MKAWFWPVWKVVRAGSVYVIFMIGYIDIAGNIFLEVRAALRPPAAGPGFGSLDLDNSKVCGVITSSGSNWCIVDHEGRHV